MPWSITWNSDASFDEDFRGRTLFNKYEIHVNTNMPLEAQRQALLHELLHLCSDSVLMGDEQLTEKQIRAVSHNLFEILYHNPEVGGYIGTGL